jgi:hypothetical protein
MWNIKITISRIKVFSINILAIACFLLLGMMLPSLYLNASRESSFEIGVQESLDIVRKLNELQGEYVFPAILENKDVVISAEILWSGDSNLIIQTKKNIVFKKGAKIVSTGKGSIILKAGMEPDDNDYNKQKISIKEKKVYDAHVRFEGSQPQIILQGEGVAKIYYNPTLEEGYKHKYHNPRLYSAHVFPSSKLEPYMLVNHVFDLKDVAVSLFSNYALSQNIDASRTSRWTDKVGSGKGFPPIKGFRDKAPFSGIFDGNGYTVSKLHIARPLEENVGLFGDVTGVNRYRSEIRNVKLEDSSVVGKRCVGGIIGQATGVKILNSSLISTKVTSVDEEKGLDDHIKGILGGCILSNTHDEVHAYDEEGKEVNESSLFGSCVLCNEREESKNNISSQKNSEVQDAEEGLSTQ